MDRVFSLFGKLVLIGVVVGLVAGGAFYLGRQTNSNNTGSSLLYTEIPTPTEKIMQDEPEASPAAQKADAKIGSIEGVLGYPSEVIPSLEVYAISTADSSKYYYVKTAANTNTFTIPEVAPGEYNVVAYASATYAGSYTKAVPCGLSVSCEDHSMIPAIVKAGEVTKGIELKDWYAPEGTFPTKPK